MNGSNRRHRADLEAIAHQAMRDRGFLPEFSPAVRAEVARIHKPATGSDSGLRDLRHLLWASIDNDDSRDLDQLSVADPQPDGTVKILVAIVDVDALVRTGSALDDHARHNTTSIYTAAELFPMLPEQLSTNLTSLSEGEDRLALVIEMKMDEEGICTAGELYRAVVHNHAKLAYNSVAAWLDGDGPVPTRIAEVPGLGDQISLQDRVAQRLKNRRHHHGALTLDTIEARPVFEEDVLVDLEVERKNRAKDLIEDFMIAANGVVARYLAAKGVPSFRRVLRAPERWQRIMEQAVRLGEHLPPEPDAGALEAFLAKQRRADPIRFPDLSLTIVKLLGSGEYVVDRPGEATAGHFGLAVRDYTHSTAPNRRYPDLITQRLLKAALSGRSVPYRQDELVYLARHCTEKEDDADRVERQVRKSAAALLLEFRIGERFEAMVTGSSEKGTWVRVLHPPVEGKLVSGGEGLDVGDQVWVKLVETNVARGYIDFVRTHGG